MELDFSEFTVILLESGGNGDLDEIHCLLVHFLDALLFISPTHRATAALPPVEMVGVNKGVLLIFLDGGLPPEEDQVLRILHVLRLALHADTFPVFLSLDHKFMLSVEHLTK